MQNKFKIIIVDDHNLFRSGLKFVLQKTGKAEVIAEAADGNEFLQIIENHEPDVVLMDIAMPQMDGIEATKRVMETNPDLKIIALTMFGDQEYYYRMIQAGAKGFLLKEASTKELEQAIETVVAGDNFFSQELLRRIILDIGNTKKKVEQFKDTEVKFSEREIEILKLICNGLSNQEIADQIHVSQRTVEGHKSHMLQKANVKNSINLVMFAIKNKIVEI